MFCEGRTMTYATLFARSVKVAAHLAGTLSGVERKVGFIGRESEAYYEVMFGCAMAGIVFVPINWRLTAREVSHILTDAGIDTLFCDVGTRNVVEESLRASQHAANVICLTEGVTSPDYREVLRDAPSGRALPTPDPDRTFCLMYTSGTTGLPKGVSLPHKAFFQIRESLVTEKLGWLDWYPEDRCLVGIPGFHIGGLWWALQSFSAGAAIVSLPQFEPRLCLEAMRTHGVSNACMVPAMINLLLDAIEEDDVRLPHLRKIVYGGAPISAALLQRGIEVLGCDFAQIYGLSETGNTAVCLDPASHRDPTLLQAAGRPYPCVSLKIVDVDGDVLPAGEVGEVCIRTPARMSGYWRLPDATAHTLRDEWIHTGDAGYLNEQGYLFICDRIKDVIITGGEKIFPAEVENAVSSFASVHECAVIGIPDDEWGERAICLLVPKSNAYVDVAALYQHLETRLASYKRPAQILTVESLPRNPSGKLLRRELRDAFWAERTRRV
ncbi:Long-chain-fatty-acid--CoA ligase [Paraburkholderia caribensis MBA4]|uniref:Long-chain-fatty-acid--CoA ligase n=1 Tax=Paraburkholderia caribensis MBA4 TaxID=1323664 RepID=A0A0P0RGU1_9BURK|nr:Long-chain-fatty-acid--CoA ligase [Paraburkholderia caribensis MBA4]